MNAVLAPVEQPIPADQVFTSGIREDLSNADYHAIDALSASGIKRILQSPLHYRFDRDHPNGQTEAMMLGTAVHAAVLEPASYDAVIMPDFNRRTNQGKADHAAFLDANAGRIILTEEQAAKVEGMVGAIKRHPIHDELIASGGRPELSLQWNDARHGEAVPCKCRFDWLRDDGIALDIKTCQDASPEGFSRAVSTFKYHYQAAWYGNGHEHVFNRSLQAFLFIAVESVAPYGCAVYVLQPNAVRFGADQCERAMLLYAQARKSGYWRSYPETVQPILLPRWATSIATPEY